MPIVTLTTDWCKNDYYTGAVKGKLLSYSENINIIDISHNIPAFNIAQAAFIVKNSYHYFPKGSIHIIDVKSNDTKDTSILLAKYNEHYIICADNGVLSLITGEDNIDAYKLTQDKDTPKSFIVLDTFVPAAIKIIESTPLNKLGNPASDIKKSMPLRAAIDKDVINGSVIYTDSYGNGITNISKSLFNRIGQQRTFEIFIQSNHYKLNHISSDYCNVATGEIIALFNSADLLEIAINNGNAQQLLNLSPNSNVRVKFYDGTSTPEMKLFNN